MTTTESVVTVDVDDRDVGTCDKLAAHQGDGVLHRAFSVLLFDGTGRLLLQRRAFEKYHFRGRWSNSCCSHPRPGEDLLEAGRRRVREELGIEVELSHRGRFVYRAVDLDSGLVEHELDHVLVGRTDAEPRPDSREVDAVRWVAADELLRWLDEEPEVFTPWFVPALQAASPSDDAADAFPAPLTARPADRS
jgi:isopentenyl-diphosphate Delta-isomerase